MELRREDGRITGTYTPETSCKDSFRYRLVEVDGRYRFDSVQIKDVAGCDTGSLGKIVAHLQGTWLDEVDLEWLGRLECKNGVGCPREIAGMVREIRELLLR